MRLTMIFNKTKEFIMKHYTKILFILSLIIGICSLCVLAKQSNTSKIDYESEIIYCQQEIEFYTTIQNNAHQMATSARALGYSDNHMIIICAKEKWQEAQSRILEATEKMNNLISERDSKWRKRKQEYPVATEIWLYLSEYGLNEHIIAGILGNMMAETGGHTLAIKDKIWDSSKKYYGICQWSLYYNPQLSGTTLEEQLLHLITSMEYEFNTFGYKYKSNFKYNDFLQMKDAEEAAMAFAKSYERCASFSYEKRKKNAIKAYEYCTS